MQSSKDRVVVVVVETGTCTERLREQSNRKFEPQNLNEWPGRYSRLYRLGSLTGRESYIWPYVP